MADIKVGLHPDKTKEADLILQTGGDFGVGWKEVAFSYEDAGESQVIGRGVVTPLEVTYRHSKYFSVHVAPEYRFGVGGYDEFGNFGRLRIGVGTDVASIHFNVGPDDQGGDRHLGGELHIGNKLEWGAEFIVGYEHEFSGSREVETLTLGLRYTLPWLAWDW